MESFTIDDVRDTMPAEVTGFLQRIESTARDLLNRMPAPCSGEESATSLLRAIGHDGHAIHGTSALVSANALASCAQLLEQLSEQKIIKIMVVKVQ